MEVPYDDYDVSVLVRCIKELEALLQCRSFATFSEVDAEISKVVSRYVQHGDGFERLRSFLLEAGASGQELQRTLVDMKLKCLTRLRECACSQTDQVNDILPFISSTSRILVHGCGNVLALAMACAIEEHEGVHFFVCEGLPPRAGSPSGLAATLLRKVAETSEGQRLGERVRRACTVIPDSGVGALMASVDFVVTGACCVTEHGGLVHATGSLQLATMASSCNVPLYVLCETFKFLRVFPLSTDDLRQPEGCGVVPLVEFVPPSLITLIFSDKGMMPPSAVADEMFRFHTAPAAALKRSSLAQKTLAPRSRT